jgi:spore coat polysaccharide biosynthesis protein SpsF
MNNEFGIVIQARCNSRRLPNKVLLDFLGEPLLVYKYNLIKQLNINYPVVIATTTSIIDDKIAELCEKRSIHYLRGEEENVFKRFQEVAIKFNFINLIRLTGDNPFTHRRLLFEGINKHQSNKADLTTTRLINPDNSIISYVPKGLSFDIISCSSLLKINSLELTDFEKEHVIPHFYNGDYLVNYIKSDMKFVEYTIDTQDQFKRIHALAKKLTDSQKLIEFLTN